MAIITRGSSGGEARVDGGHDPVEESAIQALGQTVSSCRRLYTHMYIHKISNIYCAIFKLFSLHNYICGSQ